MVVQACDLQDGAVLWGRPKMLRLFSFGNPRAWFAKGVARCLICLCTTSAGASSDAQFPAGHRAARTISITDGMHADVAAEIRFQGG
jgi:hypothetical protein